jgi:LytS/YehU family sensor histidine kinase
MATNLIFQTLWEVVYILINIKRQTPKGPVGTITITGEFEGLKQKVNPHFLFNCFNTLSSLISEDKNKAENSSTS